MTPYAAETSATAINGWIELDSRSNDGVDVSLLWSRPDQQVKVIVTDRRLDISFEIDVPSADALAAFHHPFSYASASERHVAADASRTTAAVSHDRTGERHVNH
jgi:hypothetical protein